MKTCTCCHESKPLCDFYPVRTKGRLDTFCKPCRNQSSADYARSKGAERIKRRTAKRYDAKRAERYATKLPVDLARSMAVIVAVIQRWRDHEPQKFTEFKELFRERVV